MVTCFLQSTFDLQALNRCIMVRGHKLLVKHRSQTLVTSAEMRRREDDDEGRGTRDSLDTCPQFEGLRPVRRIQTRTEGCAGSPSQRLLIGPESYRPMSCSPPFCHR
ncbi:unnamed protein product [Pleuronectes platessa]|uniref:Uncharacterized protein n=1 Tax=Pleuronectes platessa TaxID=8262 RepID=A0A9N7U544_PLEPL|nr:unnamed protein product [Pleuronectes platessa]